MVEIFKPSGPEKAVRPFKPIMGEEDPMKRIMHALEHIAVAMSAIDHHIESIAAKLNKPAPLR